MALVFTGNGLVGTRSNPAALTIDQTANVASVTGNKNHFSYSSNGTGGMIWTTLGWTIPSWAGTAYRFRGTPRGTNYHIGSTNGPVDYENSNTGQYVLINENPGNYFNYETGYYTIPQTGLYLITYGCASGQSGATYNTMVCAVNVGATQQYDATDTRHGGLYLGYNWHYEQSSSEKGLNYSGVHYLYKSDMLSWYYASASGYDTPNSTHVSITFVGG